VSSSFLYLGIVAVWAFVLVPRWLRRQQAQPNVEVDVEVDVEFAAGYRAEPLDQDDAGGTRAGGYAGASGAPGAWGALPASSASGASGASGASVVNGYGGGPSADVAAGLPPARHSPAPQPRSRVLQARRRLLTMLLLLTAVAGACTALKVTTWWVSIPPAGMLGAYLLLLRESALADAEQARRRAAMELRVQAARQRAHAVVMETDAEPSAQIIDISARVGDQLYDQYADATVRAVGD
jgi:hypothetical protein